jgi:hypothetical protein
MEKLKIQYRDFWDVPRVFVTSYQGRHYLFDCPFNDELDEYPDHYEVFLTNSLPAEVLNGSWMNIRDQAIHHLGQVPVKSVQFDETMREEIDAGILKQLGE